MTGTTRTRTRTVAAGALVLLGGTGALSGCSGGPAVVGQITPMTSAATAAAGGSPSASATVSPAVDPAPPAPETLVLADTGIGGLHLGQSKKQALATGLIGKPDGPTSDEAIGCSAYRGERGIERVYFHAGKVMIISVTRAVLTDKGIGIGDTYESLQQKYPDATLDPESELDRIYPAAPQAQIKASYRIAMSSDHAYPDDKILEIALQANAQPCYE